MSTSTPSTAKAFGLQYYKILPHGRLKPGAFVIMHALVTKGNWLEHGIECTISDRVLAQMTQQSIRTVGNHLKSLHAQGWFKAVFDEHSKRYTYTLVVPEYVAQFWGEDLPAVELEIPTPQDGRATRYVANSAIVSSEVEDQSTVNSAVDTVNITAVTADSAVDTVKSAEHKLHIPTSLQHDPYTTTTTRTRETSGGGGQITPVEVKGLDPKPTPEQPPTSLAQAVYGGESTAPKDSSTPKAPSQEDQIRPGDRMQLGQLLDPQPHESLEISVAKLFAWHEIPIDAKALRTLVTVLLTSCPNDPGALLRGVMADLGAAQDAKLKHEHKRSSWATARMKATAKRYIELYGTPPEGEKRKPKKIRGLMGREMIGTETGRQEIGRF